MGWTSLKRLGGSLCVMFIISMITFLAIKNIPGDPAQLILGTEATPEKIALLRESMGLNLSLPVQYIRWLLDFLQGNWGESYVFGEQVRTLILQRLPVTLAIAIFSMILALSFSLILGIGAALKKNSWIDMLSRSVMQLGTTLPSFWIAMILMLVFAANLHWFPVSGYIPFQENFAAFLKSIILPSFVLALSEMGVLIRIIRSSMLSALSQDYMSATQVKGLSKFAAVTRYALRDALIAPLTIASIQFAKLIGGTAIIESIFAIPGLGRLLLIAVEQRDAILLQGIVISVTFAVVLISWLTDCAAMTLNPSIRYGKQEVS